MRPLRLLLAGALALAAACTAAPGGPAPGVVGAGSSSPAAARDTPAPSPAPARVPVTKIVDGDTIHVVDAGTRITVRLIGVDTPETVHPQRPVECYGREASAFLRRLLEGEDVELRYDVQRLDRYGRTLAYVHRARDGLFVNLELVRRGYAQVLTVPPNVAHADAFLAAQRAARDEAAGLWRACT